MSFTGPMCMNQGRKASSWTWNLPSTNGFGAPFGRFGGSKVFCPVEKPTPTSGSAVSSRSRQPYWLALSAFHGCTVLLLKGSPAHSLNSWVKPLMSLLIHALGPQNPGEIHADHRNVCTGWLPLPLTGPLPLLVGLPAPWPPMTQQCVGLWSL